jgi:hypothetical protein
MKRGGTNVLQWKQVFQSNVLAFGIVSFLTDLSTEIIYPLLPVFFNRLSPPGAGCSKVEKFRGNIRRLNSRQAF